MIPPTTPTPRIQPSTKAGPLTRARALTSIRTTATIGIGLNATTTASGRICPIASPMRGLQNQGG